MKYQYEFIGETVEIEVTEEWVTVLEDLDRQEYNVNHKETRRHCSLEAYNQDNALLPSDVDVLGDVLGIEDRDRLMAAISQLSPDQRDLVEAVFFKGIRIVDYAASRGVTHSAISHQKSNAIKILRKMLS